MGAFGDGSAAGGSKGCLGLITGSGLHSYCLTVSSRGLDEEARLRTDLKVLLGDLYMVSSEE